jgi:hypothetical protein
VVTLGEIPHCILEPLGLVLRLGAYDSATHDMLKQLIACLLERRWHCDFLLLTRSPGHELLCGEY